MTETAAFPLVLIADDDAVTRAMVTAWLGRAGYEVAVARDGDEALQIAVTSLPDLVLVDVTMPGLDGYEVCRAVQAATPTPPPVIFLTAHEHTADRVAGLDAGAVDYIVKPFAQAELVARVRAALRTKAQRDTFVEQATRDGLTGLLNRRELDVQSESAVRFAARHGLALSCLMVDIDHFKRINDTLGHAAGDAVIRETARRITAVGRASDVIGRYGGEEFLLLLPATNGREATMTGDKLRRVLSERPIELDGPDISITASVGVAECEGSTATASLLTAAADRALYEAKRLGRNCTVLDTTPPDDAT